jgi:ATP-dependent DNA helicase RecG
MSKSADTPVQYLKGIGPKRARSLAKIGVRTVEDLLYYFPRRYEDRAQFVPIAKVEEGKIYTIQARVLSRHQRRSFRRRVFSILEVAVGDASGKIFCVWFNQPYLKAYFEVGCSLILYGKVENYSGRLQMNAPEFEIIGEEEDKSLSVGRIVPVYSLPEGMTQRYFRQMIKNVLDKILPALNDFLPYDIRSRNNLLNLAKSLLAIHFPETPQSQQEAYLRLSFEEFFLFQLPLAIRKLRKKEKQGISHKVDGQLVRNFIARLPFKLTASQEQVIKEISQDMAAPSLMQRLLQGDVGSGKTVVACVAGLMAIQGGYQAAFMVPTEILARQHFQNIKYQISTLRLHSGLMVSEAEPSKIKNRDKGIRIELLTSSLNNKEKDKIYKEIEEGKIDFVIGTHALLEGRVKFKNLGLVVIDEQHKFGVGQRALLPQKGGSPDVLIMTATPIPRTLAITLYADLDISVIRELPPGRKPIETILVDENKREGAYSLAKEQLRQGNQAYIIYPVIEESYALDIAGAKRMYSELKAGEFREFRLGLIHGRLKQKEQEEVMLQFKNRELDILVSTTVLEVGIDIPSATCMVVEHAERFGLAQLHQLRGRVGRGQEKSFCILVSGAETEEARQRLSAMAKYSDGFRIAEEDLKIRGPGEFFGQRQHGLSELRIANPLRQMRLLKLAREEAVRLLDEDPHLEMRPHTELKEKLLQRFPEYEKLMLAG